MRQRVWFQPVPAVGWRAVVLGPWMHLPGLLLVIYRDHDGKCGAAVCRPWTVIPRDAPHPKGGES